MNAVLAVESSMIPEDRIAGLESDVGELKSDVKVLSARVSESSIANAREFAGLRMEIEKNKAGAEKERGTLRTEIEKTRTDMEKGFGALRADMERGFGALRTDMEKGSGALRADMEKGFGALRTSIESAKLWMLVTAIGSVILAFVGFLGRALKLF